MQVVILQNWSFEGGAEGSQSKAGGSEREVGEGKHLSDCSGVALQEEGGKI